MALRRALFALGVATGLASAGCHPAPGAGPSAAPAPSTKAPDPGDEAEVPSNVLRADYAGSERCATCHEGIATSFRRSPMHRMTRDADGAEIRAPFAGETVRIGADVVHFERAGPSFRMRVETAAGSSHVYRVTRVIGGRTREDFVGVELDAKGASGGEETVLPASYLFFPGQPPGPRYKGYSVMIPERPHFQPGAIWNRTCIFCHNTEPYGLALLGALAGPGAPAYQGTLVDRILPDERQAPLVVTDDRALRGAVAEEIKRFAPFEAPIGDRAFYRRALVATRNSFRGQDLVELGIGCEACHGGARAHAEDPTAFHPSFEPHTRGLRAGPGLTRAERIDRACARCHQVLFTRYPWTWEGGKRGERPGGSHISSGEARDFLLGGCAKALACSACHDPHAADGRARIADLEAGKADAICTGCHGAYADPARLRAHAHHDPVGAGGHCMACHMPKKNMSLDVGLTRYHRIGSPTDPAKVLLDRPVECALCHADKSVESLVATMERWWNKRYDRDALRLAYGDLAERALVTTLERGKPHEQAVALAVLGETKERRLLPAIAHQLTHPIPLVRAYAKRALEATLGVPCPVDISAPADAVERDAARCLGPLAIQARAGPRAELRPPGASSGNDDDGED
jgi:predicted CXXCH cytochrome family protein